MRIKTILFLLVCFLLSGFTMPAIACPPPDCGSCCYWVSTGPDPNDGYCELIIGLSCGDCAGCMPCNSCIACFCISDCSSGQTCCGGSCCSNTCCFGTCCSAGQNCCAGSCCSNVCCNGICCEPDECCDDGQCVNKCTNTGQCDYGVLPGGPYMSCPNTDPTGFGDCQPGVEGSLCTHRAIIASNSAECADCEPNCDKTRISACAEITPVYCEEHYYIAVWTCICTQGGTPEYRGDHYECD